MPLHVCLSEGLASSRARWVASFAATDHCSCWRLAADSQPLDDKLASEGYAAAARRRVLDVDTFGLTTQADCYGCRKRSCFLDSCLFRRPVRV